MLNDITLSLIADCVRDAVGGEALDGDETEQIREYLDEVNGNE